MELKEFAAKIKDGVSRILRDGYTVEIQEIRKNNGCTRTGLVITKQGETISTSIYLNEAYDQCGAREITDQQVKQTAKKIAEQYHGNGRKPEWLKDLTESNEFNRLKDKVAYKLINTERNQELLKQIPSKPYLDLSIVYCLCFGSDEAGQYTALIYNRHLENWGVTKETICQLADENTPRIRPHSLRRMEEVIAELTEGLEIKAEDKGEAKSGHKIPVPEEFYLLSNSKGLHGAAAVLYENVLGNFAEERKSDIIILPSSIHEVILLPDTAGTNDYKELKGIVKDVNQTDVPAEDILSDHVYRYSYERKKLEIVI